MKKAVLCGTRLGKITVVEENGKIINICFKADKLPSDIEFSSTSLLEKASKQLKEYFDGKRKTFDLPLAPQGTDFQIKVWENLKKIPYGETWSYKQLAEASGNVKACRAVGGANNKNPISIIIPCHRVIGANGQLVGYAGGLDIKQKLLELETKSQ